jgi:hypothetical protein
MPNLSLVPSQPKPPLSLLAPEFQPLLSTFNELTRDIRSAGVPIQKLNFLEKCIVISEDDISLIAHRFAHEIRSQSSKTREYLTRHSVQIRGIDVSWFSLAKGQDQ